MGEKHSGLRLRKSAGTRAKSLPANDIERPSALPGADVVEQLARIEQRGGAGEVVFDDGARLPVTHLGKVFFPLRGITKGALMRYYVRAAPALLPLLRDRPLALLRHPDGVDGPRFHQHDARSAPSCARVEPVRTARGEMRPRLIGGDLATLLYTVQLGAVAVHPWLSRIGTLGYPDAMVIDLDPQPEVPFDRVVEVAQTVRAVLAEMDREAVPKTSGASGLHVLSPFDARTCWESSAELAARVAKEVAAVLPTLVTLARSPAKRPKGTVYVDHLQNARGKTVASAWSVRARPEATVSVPLAWSEVTRGLDPRHFTMEVALTRITVGAARRVA